MNETHQPKNQPAPLEDYDAFASNAWLAAAIRRCAVQWVEPQAAALGRFVGSAEAQRHAAAANRFDADHSLHGAGRPEQVPERGLR